MFRIRVASIMAVLFAACGLLPWMPLVSLPADEGQKERWALLIAVGMVGEAGPAVNDMKGLSESLTRSGLRPNRVVVLHEDRDQPQFAPTKANIEKHLKAMSARAADGDLLLVVFRGPSWNGMKQSFLCPSDGILDEPRSMIALDQVDQILRPSMAAVKLILVDASNETDPFLGARRDGGGELSAKHAFELPTDDTTAPRGSVVTLRSCSEGEVPRYVAQGGNSIFIRSLTEGLKGKADLDADRRVTLREWLSFAATETEAAARDLDNFPQRPTIFGGAAIARSDWVMVAEPPKVADAKGAPSVVEPPPKVEKKVAEEKTRIVASAQMEMIRIPAGSFVMGTPRSQQVEKFKKFVEDQVQVTLSRDFWIGKTEVTQAQWKKVMGTEPWLDDPYVKQGANYPASFIRWEDAVRFCTRLNQLENLASGERFSLPTEAQWEYACRAGTSTLFSFGDDERKIEEYGWRFGNPLNQRRDTNIFAREVGLKKPNPWGLHDMHGNVGEWTADWFDDRYTGKLDPQGPSRGQARVIRGGSCWTESVYGCQSGFRNLAEPEAKNPNVGFRVILQ